MIVGIDQIEFLPPFGKNPSLQKRITQLFSSAQSIRAAIAFWSIPPKDLETITDFRAYKVLSSPNSFLCIDLQKPTNIDYLADLVKHDVPVYIHLRRISRRFLNENSSVSLLHTKLLLADQSNESAEFWIGSHNWTQYALFGINSEASLAFHLNKKAPLYLNAEAVINDIKTIFCEKFDIKKIESYKLLQKLTNEGSPALNIIEIEGPDCAILEGEIIYILGTVEDDFEEISKVGDKIFISIQDSMNIQKKYLYSGSIKLTSNDPKGTTIRILEPCRHAFRRGNKLPFLVQKTIISEQMIESAYYIAGIKLDSLLSQRYKLFPPSEEHKPIWVEAAADPIIERLGDSALSHKKLLSEILVPANSPNAKKKESAKEPRSLDRRLIEGHPPLITRKIVKYE